MSENSLKQLKKYSRIIRLPDSCPSRNPGPIGSGLGSGLHLMRFSSTVERMAEELYPNLMTDFLYQLVDKFNARGWTMGSGAFWKQEVGQLSNIQTFHDVLSEWCTFIFIYIIYYILYIMYIYILYYI